MSLKHHDPISYMCSTAMPIHVLPYAAYLNHWQFIWSNNSPLCFCLRVQVGLLTIPGEMAV
eukprot:13050219-Ditylum_brightwellii.AAC.1